MYQYDEIRSKLFTEDGQVLFLKFRDRTKMLLKSAGAVRMSEIMSGVGGGDSWTVLACADRLIELGEIRELTDENVAGQYRVFVEA